ncbi:MAG: Phosphoserine phosphatase SerB1 [Chlamydiales bacterium]|nr:Phosphoserine phosphatase SerB1 [Chlamydiales bacterium]MCH9619877.1 Phosphoserine phosphatase SerB1 [Chlamydiales bacterium]MCH9622696.1 Phosphoserine phosphatase SerB1 [Chlamydiales bacterium]
MRKKSKTSRIKIKNTTSPSVVAFDLDGTLLKGNSSFALARYLYQKGVFTFADFLCCFKTYITSWYQHLPLIDLHKKAFSRFFKGKTLEEYSNHASNFVAAKVSHMLYAPAMAELQKWKDAGAKIVLLSSSPDFLVQAIAKVLGITNVFGTPYLVDSQGILTDIDYLLDGRMKAHLLNNEVNSDDVTMAYSDHFHDLAFLESVSCPVVVNPERRLKRIARKRGWKIL